MMFFMHFGLYNCRKAEDVNKNMTQGNPATGLSLDDAESPDPHQLYMSDGIEMQDYD